MNQRYTNKLLLLLLLLVYIDDHGSGTVNDGGNGTEASSTQPGMLC
jgi:hypothetical protein